MAQHSRLDVLRVMIEDGLVPIFYNPDVETAVNIVEACVSGGAHCIEFTNRGDLAHCVFEELIRRFSKQSQVVLGVGSVLDPATAALYIQLGANFVVGPVLNPDAARVCNRRKVAYMPGCGSVSEISAAEELGVEICKIFPGEQVGGPDFVRSVLGPMPWTRIMPTGGVDATQVSIDRWFKAGVSCVGMGSNLITKESVAKQDYVSITGKVRQTLEWIQHARS